MANRLLRIAVRKAALPAFEEALIDLGGALWADTKGDPDPVPLEVTLPGDCAQAAVTALLAELAAAGGVTPPAAIWQDLPDKDWVAESQRNLPPQIAGGFFVHGSHVKEAPPPGLIPLLVEASIAFGTGRHETTQGCLNLIADLAHGGMAVARALDLGCGSGVLAMAIAKLWPTARILAVDNDPPSVRVAAENAVLNGVAAQIETLVSEGFAAPALSQTRFDLIAANILAPPLIALAPEVPRHLAPGGWIVLSGLLTGEAPAVAAAYARVGLTLERALELGPWQALLLRLATTSAPDEGFRAS